MKILVAARQDLSFGPVLSPLNDSTDFKLLQTDSADEVLEHLSQDQRVKVLLLDFDLPGLSGLNGIQTVHAALGARALGALVPNASCELAKRVVASGARGVLPPNLSSTGMSHAIELLVNGEIFVMFDHRFLPNAPATANVLSERELQVLHGICGGGQNKEIAHDFGIREVTVKMHVRAIIRKLGARNRTHAAMIAKDLGLV